MDERQILQQAKQAIQQGNKTVARQALFQVIKANPRNEIAWLWLSAIVDDPAKEHECLKRVLSINPKNEIAQRHLEETSQPEIIPTQQTLQPMPTPPQPTPSPLVPCPYCAELIRKEAIVCRYCGRDLKAHTQAQPIQRQTQGLPIDQRTAILDREITKYVGRGFRLQSRSDTTAQLVKPKKFSFVLAALGLLCWVVGLILYLFYYWSQKDKTVFIQVDPQGRIIDSSGNVIHPSQTTKTPKKATRKKVVLVLVVVVLCAMFLCGLGVLIYPITPRVPLKVPEPVTYHRTVTTSEVKVPDVEPGEYNYNKVTIEATKLGSGFESVILADDSGLAYGHGGRFEEWTFDQPMQPVTRYLPSWVAFICPVPPLESDWSDWSKFAFTITFSCNR